MRAASLSFSLCLSFLLEWVPLGLANAVLRRAFSVFFLVPLKRNPRQLREGGWVLSFTTENSISTIIIIRSPVIPGNCDLTQILDRKKRQEARSCALEVRIRARKSILMTAKTPDRNRIRSFARF